MIIIKSLFAMIRIVIFLMMMVILFVTFYSTDVGVKTEDATTRANIEIADNLLKSRLTYDMAVFNEDELDNAQEMPFSFCGYAYMAVISDKKGNVWNIGYKPQTGIEATSEKKYPVSIGIINNNMPGEFYDTVKPAEMTLTVYETWLTKISCALENAYRTKSVQKVENLCKDKCEMAFGRAPEGDNTGYEKACLYQTYALIDTIECIGTGLPEKMIIPSSVIYDKDDVPTGSEKVFWAIPIDLQKTEKLPKYEDYNEMIGKFTEDICNILKDQPDYTATEESDVGAVAVCLSECGNGIKEAGEECEKNDDCESEKCIGCFCIQKSV
ncbi:MAG TPA: hypothetical protein VJB11_01860 [archaeon]|nr:hypothetical protein [archaeon]